MGSGASSAPGRGRSNIMNRSMPPNVASSSTRLCCCTSRSSQESVNDTDQLAGTAILDNGAQFAAVGPCVTARHFTLHYTHRHAGGILIDIGHVKDIQRLP